MKSRVAENYQVDAEAVVRSLKTKKSGLSTAEANERLASFGKNKLKKINKDPAWLKFLRQFKDLMIILLVVSALLALYLRDIRTGIVLLVIILINTIIGFSQEYKAERLMESLDRLIEPNAHVYRDGELRTIAAELLVPGDVIFVSEGDAVPADARIIEEAELATNDFALTGESNPSRKFIHAIKGSVEIGNRRNMVFMGTTVASGNAHAVVTATGMHTELGRIASLSQGEKDTPSPLQREMTSLALRITLTTMVLAALLIVVALGDNLSFKDAVLFAIGIASAMIPQGLPAEVNTALARAAGELARQKALVKKLSAVETLGATKIICTDKTGTLTKNQMTVEQIVLPDGSLLSVSGSGYEPIGAIHDAHGLALDTKGTTELWRFLACGVFASNATVSPPDDEHSQWYCVGDPTEGALITLARKGGLDTKGLESTHPEQREFPFDSIRKRMSSLRTVENQTLIFTKGAPESVLAACTHIELGGRVRRLTAADRSLILKANDVYAEKALRNLAYAYRPLSSGETPTNLTLETAEQQLVYMGMVSMIDPIRDEVADAMEAARAAHVKVSIITGDYAPTAKAIAVRAKLADSVDDLVLIPGDALPTMPDKKVLEYVSHGGVIFARVSPEDKLRIVSLVRRSGQVIAVTGDGINDAPALKAADIGVAMGLTGTDVAKQSAEIVLLDDSFHTLVGAIKSGRVIFENIRKATLSALSSNFAELVTVLISLYAASRLGIPPAISAIQILAIDLIAELFPIAALAWDSSTRNSMTEPPRSLKNHIFTWRTFGDLAFTGVVMGSLAYTNFILFAGRHGIAAQNYDTSSQLYAAATTITYVTICVFQYINVLIRRTPERTLSRYMFSNRELWIAIGISLFCVLNIVYNPLIHKVFGTYYLGVVDWLYVVVSALAYFAIREAFKTLQRVRSS